MNVYPKGWALDPRRCPCDVDFVEYLVEAGLRKVAIFHFGTGSHHHVGIECVRLQNAVLGVTLSVDEHASYVALALERPEITKTYKVMFADIYLTDKRLLPSFDVVFLPHLCEFDPQANKDKGFRTYEQVSDADILNMFTETSKPDAQFVFYSQSRRFSAAKTVIREWSARSNASQIRQYKSLHIYRKPI